MARECVILASGPSLIFADIQATAHLDTIAVNNTWEAAGHCKIIYAGDFNWWHHNHHKIDIDAERWSRSKRAQELYQARYDGGKGNYNSGQAAIELAIKLGYQRIVLLGFDCSLKNGIHHHSDHEKTANPDDSKVKKWHQHFSSIDRKGAQIINCSRYTELTCFERVELEQVL